MRLRVDPGAPLPTAFAPRTLHGALLPTELGDQGAASAAGHAFLRRCLPGLVGDVEALACQRSRQISGRASV